MAETQTNLTTDIPAGQPGSSWVLPTTPVDTQTTSTQITNPPVTNEDIASLLFKNVNKQNQLMQDVAAFYTPTEEEKTAKKNLDTAQNTLENFDISVEGGVQNIMNKPIAMPFQQGQAAALTRDAAFTRSSLSRKVDAYTKVLQSTQATRQQKLDAAKFLFSANSQNLADTISLMKATAPENIATTVDQFTGEMTVTMKNPVTGELSTKNLGVVQTPQKQINNVQFAQENAVSKPFYTKDGRTIINTNTGREYSKPEQFFADGGSRDFSNVEQMTGANLLQRKTVVALGDQYKDAGILPTDTMDEALAKLKNSGLYNVATAGKYLKIEQTDPDTGLTTTTYVNPTTHEVIGANGNYITGGGTNGAAISNYKTQGEFGGQCGDYAHELVNFPSVGDSKTQKFKSVQDNGLLRNDWINSGPKVGDVLIFDIKNPYGHVAVVNSVNDDGTVTLSESNYNGDKKVTNDRRISINDKTIYGAIRGTPKVGAAVVGLPPEVQSNYKNAMSAALTSGRITGTDAQKRNREFNAALASGNLEQARQLILNTATAQMTADERNRAFGRATALSAINDIKKYIDEYTANGGNTNLLVGTTQDIANKLGTTIGYDQAYIQARILGALQSYRKSMTGVAFGPQESAEYAKLFPGLGKTGAFNAALLDAFRDGIDNQTRSILEYQLGSDNYENLFGLRGQQRDALYAHLNDLSNTSEDAFANELNASLNAGGTAPAPTNSQPVTKDLNSFLNESPAEPPQKPPTVPGFLGLSWLGNSIQKWLGF